MADVGKVIYTIASSALGYVIAQAFITSANVTGTASTLFSVGLIVLAGAGALVGMGIFGKKKM